MKTLILDGRPLPLKNALGLVRGGPIPHGTQNLLGKPFMSNRMYKMLGSIGWKQQARNYGAQKDLKRQPYS